METSFQHHLDLNRNASFSWTPVQRYVLKLKSNEYYEEKLIVRDCIEQTFIKP